MFLTHLAQSKKKSKDKSTDPAAHADGEEFDPSMFKVGGAVGD